MGRPDAGPADHLDLHFSDSVLNTKIAQDARERFSHLLEARPRPGRNAASESSC
jgi:hypothetical protein